MEPMKARHGVPFASFRAEVVAGGPGAVWPAGPGKHPARGPRIPAFGNVSPTPLIVPSKGERAVAGPLESFVTVTGARSSESTLVR